MPPQIQHKRGTSSDIASVNPILLDGEIVFETDTKKFKFGDGSTSWNNLPYAVLPNSGVSISGINIISGSGNFNTLTISSVPVSVSGHSHTSSNITNFNTAVSGLISGIYQPLLTNPVTGVGTSGYLSRWNGSNSLTSGIIFDNGTRIGINNPAPSSVLDVIGESRIQGLLYFNQNSTDANDTSRNRCSITREGGQQLILRGGSNTLNLAGDGGKIIIRSSTVGTEIGGDGANTYVSFHPGSNNEKARITASGFLGIGTSTPTRQLHVIGTGLIASTTGLPANALLDVYSTTSGEMVFNVEGTNGSLFSVIDNLSGSLMSVNNNAGLPIFEVFSDDSIIAGRFNQNDFVISSGGNIGIGKALPSVKLDVVGTVAVSGAFSATTKSFKIDHPSKPDHTLEYGSLESPYHGVRLTGRDKVSKGICVVKLPSYLKDLIHNDDSINIQLTNLYHGKILYISKIDLSNNNFIVCAKRAKSLLDLEFCWTFTGIRKDVDLVVENIK